MQKISSKYSIFAEIQRAFQVRSQNKLVYYFILPVFKRERNRLKNKENIFHMSMESRERECVCVCVCE